MSKRNIYFYSLKVIQTTVVNGEVLENKFNVEEVYEYLKKIHTNLPSNADGLKYLKHDIVGDIYYLLEFLDFDENSTFIRLGKPSQNNEVGKRSTESYKLVDIPLEKTELIESYTYMYIDFKTDVVSFVRVGGAPSIKWFAVSLTSYNSTSGIKVSCVPFTTDEILESFGTKADIGSITITTVKPTAQVSSFLNGVTEKDINDLKSDETTFVMTIKPPKRGGNTTKDTGVLSNLFYKAKNNERNMKKFVINIAEEMDDKKSGVDLLNYKFIRSSDILSSSKLSTQQYKNEIVKVYERELMTLKKIFKI